MKTLNDLDSFARAYLLCALWTWDDNAPSGDYETSGRPEGLFPLIAPEALEKAEIDCGAFQLANAVDLWASRLSDSRAGHNFWLNRNGHGSGFWDECASDDPAERQAACERLSDASKAFGSCDLYQGDDGKLYLS